jgi:hypothetical protein
MWKRAIIILAGTACGAVFMAIWPDRDRNSGVFAMLGIATLGGGLLTVSWPLYFAFFVMAEWGTLKGQQAPFVNLGQSARRPALQFQSTAARRIALGERWP